MPSPLHFLKEKPQAGVITEVRGGESEDPGLMAAAQELIRAVESKNARAVALALRSAFELLDSMPHEEGPHLEGE